MSAYTMSVSDFSAPSPCLWCSTSCRGVQVGALESIHGQVSASIDQLPLDHLLKGEGAVLEPDLDTVAGSELA